MAHLFPQLQWAKRIPKFVRIFNLTGTNCMAPVQENGPSLFFSFE